MSTKLTLGFSPCPNDCFIFDAMIHGKIDTEGLEFNVIMEDVESLNRKAFEGKIDITKLSYHAFAYLTDKYVLLDAGSALGKGCGPLVVSSLGFKVSGLGSSTRIAIPGNLTTANFLFSLAYPQCTNKTEIVFSKIEDAVLNGEVDAGVIIHENRFTYEQKGLKKIIDLGEFWETKTNLPIPLGGIVINRNLADEIKHKVNRVLKKSVEYAFVNPKSSLPFVKQHAQEMSEEVMYKHIDLYVNNYSLDLGTEGKEAINRFFEEAGKLKIAVIKNKSIFLT